MGWVAIHETYVLGKNKEELGHSVDSDCGRSFESFSSKPLQFNG